MNLIEKLQKYIMTLGHILDLTLLFSKLQNHLIILANQYKIHSPNIQNWHAKRRKYPYLKLVMKQILIKKIKTVKGEIK